MTTHDVVIVGAGIHGAGVAQAAAAAGYSALVLERAQPAAGTSGKSSKLIHGGLRYLQHGHLRLVREAVRERERLLRLAPGLVRRLPFHIPVYAVARHGALAIRAGLSLYALLGGLNREVRFTSIPRREWSNLDGLATEGLAAVYRYTDAQTDDARLTRAVLRSAQQLGAELRCPAEFSGAHRRPGGYEIRYVENGGERECLARTLVNAAGAWVEAVLTRVAPRPAAPPVEFVQGAHIVLAGTLVQGAYYVESPRDGRPVFVLPQGDATLVGTTETRFRGDPAQAAARPEEIAYLQETVARYFPARDTGVRSHFAGVRVLPHGTGAFAQRTRETVLFAHDPRFVSILGGKLTTYRLTAARTLRLLARVLPPATPRADTATLPLAD